MSKGDNLLVPIYAMNTDKDVWGGDALEFKYALDLEPLLLEIHPDSSYTNRPERWESPPETASEHPGVWSNIMSFLGGTRACIGYQFTLLELVHCLLRVIQPNHLHPAG